MTSTERLTPLLLPERMERLREVLASRVTSVTLVLENLHKDFNISAILRTCEAFGIHRVHVVPQPGEGKVFRTVTQGCHKWLDIQRHEDVASCFAALKADGFRILAGAFHDGAVPLAEADFPGRVALVFSNELGGASPDVLDLVDGFFLIPLTGFSRSLNVSVAAGIVLHHVLGWKGNRGEDLEGIPETEARLILEDWVRKSVKNADQVLRELGRRG